MKNYGDKKTILGKSLFAVSIFMLIYMLINPLCHQIINIGEYFTLTLINFPIPDIISMSKFDINPPLYYLLATGVSILSGILNLESNLYLLKVTSIIPYIILLIVSFVKLSKDYDWLVAGLFTFSMAVMSEFFIYFLSLRPYSWALLFVVLSFIYFKDIISTNDRKSWILFTTFSILSAYSYYYAGITSLCLYMILLIYMLKFDKKLVKNWGISLITLIVCYIPWILPLINLLESVQIPPLTLDLIIQTIPYFAYSGDTISSIIALLVFVLIGIIYAKNSVKEDQFYIFSGIGAFILTLILGIAISLIVKPILLSRCLLPASGLVWLSISIILTKINDKKMFLISLILIFLVLLNGIGFMIAQTDSLYKSSLTEKIVLDNIVSDNNSMVILTTPNMIVYFLDYADKCDMYCINKVNNIYGENITKVHQFFNFKDINSSEINNLKNSNKTIYLISWGKPDVKLNTTILSNERGVVISQVN